MYQQTPVEQTKIAVKGAEDALAEAERAPHRLDAEVNKFIGKGEPGDAAGRVLWRDQLQHYHDQASELKAAADAARVALQTAKERRDRALRDLDDAERVVANLRVQATTAEAGRLRAQDEADGHQRTRDTALAALPAAEERLARLRPTPVPVAPVAAPVVAPAPVVPPAPSYPLPARTIFDYGATRYFNEANHEVQRDGSPITRG